MREVEVKVLEIDRPKTEEKLRSMGARMVFDGAIHAIYYDSPDDALKKTGGALRLRREGEKTVLTFKSHVHDDQAKVREEKEVLVSDFDQMRSILSSLGFTAWLEMKKHRTTYELEGVRFEFDKYHEQYEYIPEFLEIEGGDFQVIEHYAGLLGHSGSDLLPWDAVELASYYAKAGNDRH